MSFRGSSDFRRSRRTLSRSVIYGRFGSSYEFPILFVLDLADLNFRHTVFSSERSFTALPSTLISRVDIEDSRKFSGRADVVASLHRPKWNGGRIVIENRMSICDTHAYLFMIIRCGRIRRASHFLCWSRFIPPNELLHMEFSICTLTAWELHMSSATLSPRLIRI